MTSCTPNTLSCGGSGGCMGSVTQLGFNYLQLFGSVKEEDWPYVSGTTGQWHGTNITGTANVSNVECVYSKVEEAGLEKW